MDRILISDLRVQARVGVTDEERARPQALRVTVEILTDMEAAASSDDLAMTIDYGRTVTEIAELVRTHESRLLEHVAGRLASHISTLEGVLGVNVEVAKEAPPVTEDVGGISVRIERRLQT